MSLPSQLPHVDGVRHRFVGANGITFHVAEAGEGDDVVLLLHGWPQHWYEWRHLFARSPTDHRVIALDLRGFGWSDAPAPATPRSRWPPTCSPSSTRSGSNA